MATMSVIGEFVERLTAVDGFAHGPMPEPNAMATAIDLGGDPGLYLGWDDVGLPRMHQSLQAVGWKRLDQSSENRFVEQQRMSEVTLGITGADGAIARSGSIALRSGPGRPRMASLIPGTHIAFLSVDRVFPTLLDLSLERLDPESASNLVLITGPSRTGDIEQQLNLGVHGPKQLHVILYR
ncbi:MAG TPA: lactate utilization protein [Acidimicrobiia bacterium]|jgi:L-lactate dehydrogenase complex protein LldG|nr:lactate utilization protein [Acidimicrobiia bacterium]